MTAVCLAQCQSGNFYLALFKDSSKEIKKVKISEQFGLYSLTTTIPSNIEALVFRFSSWATSCNAKILAAKLEIGDHQTLAHQETDGSWVLNDSPPNKALELLKCQRFFYYIGLEAVKYSIVGMGIANSSFVTIPVKFSSTMRAWPSLIYDGNFSLLENANVNVKLDVTRMDLGINSSTPSIGNIAVYAEGIKPGSVYTLNRSGDSAASLSINSAQHQIWPW